ncbi:uncharacterized protein LOC134435951 [Engraulis encrasicolus]|uniref:uncharacterized protein LOC134435951 n=1 Tax=Engraulis encrasicolus TaxID=184585 RepID=UPI002FD67510
MAAERVIWSVEDVKTLLTIWAEDSVQRKIDGVCRNEDVMKFISSEMAKVGVFRTTRQVREKLKKLRASYKAAKIHNGRSGVAPKKFPFYDLMDSVLGHRPSQSTGRNTAELQPAENERPIPTPEPNSRLCETPEMEDSVVESDAETSVMGDAEGEGEGPPAREVRQQPSHHIPPRTRAEPKRRTYQQDLLASLERVAREDRECEVKLREMEMKSEQEMREREMEKTEQLGQELALQMQLAREAWAEQMRREDSRGKEMLSLLAAMINKK